MKMDRTASLLAASRDVFEKANTMLQNLCAEYNLEFKASETPCGNEVTEWVFLCGQFNIILHLNYSLANCYFSVRTLIRKDGDTPGRFSSELLKERRYNMLSRPDGSVAWVSQIILGAR